MIHHWRARFFIVSLLLLVTITVWQVQVRSDISTFIMAGQGSDGELLAAELQSGKLSRRYLLSLGHRKADQQALESFSRHFLSRLRELDAITDVWVSDDANAIVDVVTSLYVQHASGLYSLKPEQAAAELFLPKNLDQRARFIKDSLLSPRGGQIKAIVLHDPLLLTLQAFRERLQSLRAVGDTRGEYVTAIVEARDSGLDVPAHKGLQQSIRAVFDQSGGGNSDVTLDMTGVPVFAVATQSMISGDIQRVTVLASLALSALYVWLFRSWKSLLWVSMVLGFSLTAALLITQFVFGYVHGLTIAIGATLIGVCIDYPIHALVHASAWPGRDKVGAVIRIWPTLLIGAITTVIGYCALGLSGFPGFQQIAVYAGSGVLISLLITRHVLPDLMYGWRSRGHAAEHTPLWLIWCDRRSTVFRTILLAFATVSVLLVTHIEWIEDLQAMTPEIEFLKRNDHSIRSRMAASIEPGRFITVSGKDLQTALRTAERLYPVLNRLQRRGDLEHYYGLYPWLVSDELQQRNRSALDKQITEANQALWRQALRRYGLAVPKLGTFNYDEMDHRLAPESVMDSSVQRILSGQVVSNGAQTVLVVWLARHQPEAVIEAVENLPGVHYFSQRDTLNRMASEYRQRAAVMLGLGIVAVLALLTVRYRRPIRAIVVLLPALCSALLVLACWSASGLPLSFLHLVALLLVVAICVDYGIFYYENKGDNRTVTYRAMTASMLTSVVAFGSLGVAQSAVLRTLAVTVAGGVLLGLLLCPVLISRHRGNLRC